MRAQSMAALLIASTIALSGCEWKGLNSIPLPGSQGRGDDAYSIQIEMPNVTTLTENSPVRVNDVVVGSIRGFEVKDWKALVTVSLNSDVSLPANTFAKIGQTSLLGSQHLELLQPVGEVPEGKLGEGDIIPLERAGTYPTTEQTLSALSVVLSDGGLSQFQTIAREANEALNGREDTTRRVIESLEKAISGLDKQKADIVAAMEGIDRLAAEVDKQTVVLEKSLDELPAAVKLLNDQKKDLSSALINLGEFGDKAAILVDEAGPGLTQNLNDLVPLLTQLSDTGINLTQVLSSLITFPFPQSGIDSFIRGDYANLYIEADFRTENVRKSLLLDTPLGYAVADMNARVGRAGTLPATTDPYSLDVPSPQPLVGPDGVIPGTGPAANQQGSIPAPQQEGTAP